MIALTERFAQFRAESERGTRVPAELRAAALAALRQGALQRDCQISRSQLDAWRRAAAAPSTRSRPATGEDARIFAVVDEALPVDERAATAEPPLELRVGPWSAEGVGQRDLAELRRPLRVGPRRCALAGRSCVSAAAR
ncbi:MAG: hypothetical protein IPK13_10270 [Deltaproteobacteria bacterium]|nr:hypothetical protein [Deltaproteobacteria bacterium]